MGSFITILEASYLRSGIGIICLGCPVKINKLVILTLFILMDYPIDINTINMELSSLYFKMM